MCKSDKDCDVCEECLKTPNHHFKSCVRTGTKCKRDKDCRENQVETVINAKRISFLIR